MNADVKIIAIASCSLFVIGIALWVQLSDIKGRLNEIIKILQNRA